MPTFASPLTDPSVEIILAYASTGLGHLRVTNALFEAAPPGVYPHLLRTRDQTASTLHRVTSLSSYSRALLEWSQNGLPEELFTRSYRAMLRLSHREIEAELSTLIEQEFKVVKTVIIVATHFGLAHQIAGAKEELSKKLGVKIILVVVVTDDSPQKLWYVSGANLLVVPSLETKKSLRAYAERNHFENIPVAVLPYPLSPSLFTPLKKNQLKSRRDQFDPASTERIQVSVPISGAAVNLDYLEELMSSLYRKNPRFYFYVISRKNMYTESFLRKIGRRQYVSLITSTHDREIVKYYNDLLASTPISFEITKPSEQTFKVLIPTQLAGGMTLLLSQAVGRQEHDNVSFLKRNEYLGARAFQISSEPRVAAEMIQKHLKERTFLNAFSKGKLLNTKSSNGAKDFWTLLQSLNL